MSVRELVKSHGLTSTYYPDEWDDFIGQDTAKRTLQVKIASAKERGEPLSHVLLASGTPGVGKTTLGLLVASTLDTRMKMVSGKMSANEARITLSAMRDGDVLFIDEVHQLVKGGKSNAEWLLHLLQDGVLMGPRGPEPQPKVTVIGATTDAGRLPETVLSRFPIKPVLEPYTLDEAAMIAAGMARTMLSREAPWPSHEDFEAIATAANHNPRIMSSIIQNMRDLVTVDPEAAHDGLNYDLTEPLKWLGLTMDGLDDTAQRYLVTLMQDFEGQAGGRSMQDRLQEPGGVDAVERVLMGKGYIVKTRQGRTLTADGITRAQELAEPTNAR